MQDDELKRLLDAHAAENRRHFDEIANRLAAEHRHSFELASEGLRHEIQLVAESVANVDEKLDRKAVAIEERMERGFADTQAMIKFSHAELDRRVRALEESQRNVDQTLADMQARIERLESSAH